MINCNVLLFVVTKNKFILEYDVAINISDTKALQKTANNSLNIIKT